MKYLSREYSEADVQNWIDNLTEEKSVIVPSDWTIWMHCATVDPTEKSTRSWHEIPTNEFKVRNATGEGMSFSDLNPTIEYNESRDFAKNVRDALPKSYASAQSNLPFRINLIVPTHKELEKMHKIGVLNDKEYKLRVFEESEKSGYRHPQVSDGVDIIVFGCNKDKNDVHEVYAVRRDDLIHYVLAVAKPKYFGLLNEDWSRFKITKGSENVNYPNGARVEVDESLPIVLKSMDKEKFVSSYKTAALDLKESTQGRSQ